MFLIFHKARSLQAKHNRFIFICPLPDSEVNYILVDVGADKNWNSPPPLPAFWIDKDIS